MARVPTPASRPPFFWNALRQFFMKKALKHWIAVNRVGRYLVVLATPPILVVGDLVDYSPKQCVEFRFEVFVFPAVTLSFC